MARELVLSGQSCSVWGNGQVPGVDDSELVTQNCILNSFKMGKFMLYSFTTIKKNQRLTSTKYDRI